MQESVLQLQKELEAVKATQSTGSSNNNNTSSYSDLPDPDTLNRIEGKLNSSSHCMLFWFWWNPLELESQIQAMQSAASNAINDKKMLESSLHKLLEDIEARSAENMSLKREIESLRSNSTADHFHEIEIQEAKSKCEGKYHLANVLNIINWETTALEKSLADYQSQSEAWTTEKLELNDIINSLQSQIESLKNANVSNSFECADLKSQLNSFQLVETELIQLKESSAATIAQLESTITVKDNEINDLSSQLQNLAASGGDANSMIAGEVLWFGHFGLLLTSWCVR